MGRRASQHKAGNTPAEPHSAMGYASLYQERNLASCRIYLELPRPQVDGLNNTAPALLSRLCLALGARRSATPCRPNSWPSSSAFVRVVMHSPIWALCRPTCNCSPRSSRSLPVSGSRSDPYELEGWLVMSRVLTGWCYAEALLTCGPGCRSSDDHRSLLCPDG